MTRREATRLLAACLERVVAGEDGTHVVHEIWLFGSYLLGAPDPGDVDLIAFYEPDLAMRCAVADMVMSGNERNPQREVATALRGEEEGLHIQLMIGPAIAPPALGSGTMMLWRRGEPAGLGLARARGIEPAREARGIRERR